MAAVKLIDRVFLDRVVPEKAVRLVPKSGMISHANQPFSRKFIDSYIDCRLCQVENIIVSVSTKSFFKKEDALRKHPKRIGCALPNVMTAWKPSTRLSHRKMTKNWGLVSPMNSVTTAKTKRKHELNTATEHKTQDVACRAMRLENHFQ